MAEFAARFFQPSPTNVPNPHDAILGGQFSANHAVLGGLAGVKQRLASHNSLAFRLSALNEALAYHDAGKELILSTLEQDRDWQMRRAAYWLIPDRVRTLHPYRDFGSDRPLDLSVDLIPENHQITDLAMGGNDLLAVSTSQNTQIWDDRTGHLLTTIPQSGSVAICPSGTQVFCGSGRYDGNISAWAWQDGSPKSQMISATKGAEVDAIAISADGKVLIGSSGYQGKIRAWQTSNRELIYTCMGQAPLVISHNGQQFFCGSKDGNIKIYSVRNGTLLRSIPTQFREVMAIAVSADGKLLANGGWDGTVCLQHLMRGNLAYRLVHSGSPITALAISPDGKAIASGCYGGKVKIWNLSTGELLCQLAEYSEGIRALAFSADGATLAIALLRIAKVVLWRAA